MTNSSPSRWRKGFLHVADRTSKELGIHSRTESIRAALREKIDEARMKEAMMSIAHLKGAAKKKISSKRYEAIREKVFEAYTT